METTNIIEQLLNARKIRIDHTDLFSIYEQLGIIGVIETSFGPGKSIIRGRLNEGCSFTKASELSFKPQEFNKTYQRASTPNNTMFYGSIRPEKTRENEIEHPYVIVGFEISPFLRNPNEFGELTITFGKWDLIDEIKVAAVVFEKEFLGKTALSEELNHEFNKFIKNHPEFENKTTNWNNFIAGEFSKMDIKSEYDYLFSSTYTEFMLNKGFDGIFYPSVKAEGRGFNIALRPDIIKKVMRLSVVAECTFYKFKKQLMMDWDKICIMKPDSENIIFEKDVENHLGKEFCLNMINDNIAKKL